MNPATLCELAIATSFAAGLNVYVTVLTLGLVGRLGWVTLPSGLHGLEATWVLVAAGVLLAADFVADKIPGFDLVWNVAHTVVRLPAAALLAYGATTHLSPGLQVLAVALGTAVASVAHGSKIAARAAVSASPEPVSNGVLSVAGDSAAVGMTWAATHHPLVAAGVTGGLVLAGVMLIVMMATTARRVWAGVRERWLGSSVAQAVRPGSASPVRK